MSHLTCHVSLLFFFFFGQRGGAVGEGRVINWATPSSLFIDRLQQNVMIMAKVFSYISQSIDMAIKYFVVVVKPLIT